MLQQFKSQDSQDLRLIWSSGLTSHFMREFGNAAVELIKHGHTGKCYSARVIKAHVNSWYDVSISETQLSHMKWQKEPSSNHIYHLFL